MMIRWGFAGKYSVESSQACTNCTAGKYSQEAGAQSESVCTSCEAGKYSESSAATVCTDCVAEF
jgi:hypothetical protein